jgi:ribosome-associated toxin RatA of RatAB toxin-antitoxin module
MRKVSEKDKLFFFERSFFTLDGLWMIHLEDKSNWEIALKIDSKVWVKLLEIIIRRLKKYLNIREKGIEELIEILTFRWSAEGWKFKIFKKENEYTVLIQSCPYKSTMERNPERRDKILLICRDMCIPFYKGIVNNFNSRINLTRRKFMGLGDEVCSFSFSYQKEGLIDINTNEKELFPKKLTDSDKLFYFEKNFRTLDGLWVIETHEELGWETTLQIDTIVWQELYKIIFRRVIKYLKIQEHSLDNLAEILSFIWNCEGNLHEIHRINNAHITINIVKCPYVESMERNSERKGYIASICEKMCANFLNPVIKDYNNRIIVTKESSIGLGDQSCKFTLRYS